MKDDVVGQLSHQVPGPIEAVGCPTSMPQWKFTTGMNHAVRKMSTGYIFKHMLVAYYAQEMISNQKSSHQINFVKNTRRKMAHDM
jgi:hypothetical protein